MLGTLDRSGSSVGTRGVEARCRALKGAGGSRLRERRLSRLPLDDTAAAALAGLLAATRSLERLVIARTAITDAGAQLLCNALQVRAALCAGWPGPVEAAALMAADLRFASMEECSIPTVA